MFEGMPMLNKCVKIANVHCKLCILEKSKSQAVLPHINNWCSVALVTTSIFCFSIALICFRNMPVAKNDFCSASLAFYME